MSKRDEILKALEAAELADVEVIREEEGVTLVRFFYDFDEEELSAAQHFAEIEESDEGFDDIASEEQDEDSIEEEVEVTDVLEELEEETLTEAVRADMELSEEAELTDKDLAYEEDEEFYGGAREKYLSEIAIDYAGEVLEDLQDELGMEVQYIGYDLDEENSESFEFVALIFEKGRGLNIEDVLDELDI